MAPAEQTSNPPPALAELIEDLNRLISEPGSTRTFRKRVRRYLAPLPALIELYAQHGSDPVLIATARVAHAELMAALIALEAAVGEHHDA